MVASTTGSLAGLRLRFEHTRLSYAVHQLGDVLIAHVPQVIPGQEAFGRPAGDFGEQLAPVFNRRLGFGRIRRPSGSISTPRAAKACCDGGVFTLLQGVQKVGILRLPQAKVAGAIPKHLAIRV